MRAPKTDPYIRDLDNYTHEAGHALVAFALGRRLVRVVGHRHHALTDGECGSVEWLGGEDDPYGTAQIFLAGLLATGDLTAGNGETSDEREARRLCPLGWKRARVTAWALLQRRAHANALRALSAALMDAPVMSGPTAEKLLREVMWNGSQD